VTEFLGFRDTFGSRVVDGDAIGSRPRG